MPLPIHPFDAPMLCDRDWINGMSASQRHLWFAQYKYDGWRRFITIDPASKAYHFASRHGGTGGLVNGESTKDICRYFFCDCEFKLKALHFFDVEWIGLHRTTSGLPDCARFGPFGCFIINDVLAEGSEDEVFSDRMEYLDDFKLRNHVIVCSNSSCLRFAPTWRLGGDQDFKWGVGAEGLVLRHEDHKVYSASTRGLSQQNPLMRKLKENKP